MQKCIFAQKIVQTFWFLKCKLLVKKQTLCEIKTSDNLFAKKNQSTLFKKGWCIAEHFVEHFVVQKCIFASKMYTKCTLNIFAQQKCKQKYIFASNFFLHSKMQVVRSNSQILSKYSTIFLWKGDDMFCFAKW